MSQEVVFVCAVNHLHYSVWLKAGARTRWFCWCLGRSAAGQWSRGSEGHREQTRWRGRWLTSCSSPPAGRSWKKQKNQNKNNCKSWCCSDHSDLPSKIQFIAPRLCRWYWSLSEVAHLTRWKMRRSSVLRCVLLSWSITEYTPRITSRLSGWPERTTSTRR